MITQKICMLCGFDEDENKVNVYVGGSKYRESCTTWYNENCPFCKNYHPPYWICIDCYKILLWRQEQ